MKMFLRIIWKERLKRIFEAKLKANSQSAKVSTGFTFLPFFSYQKLNRPMKVRSFASVLQVRTETVQD